MSYREHKVSKFEAMTALAFLMFLFSVLYYYAIHRENKYISSKAHEIVSIYQNTCLKGEVTEINHLSKNYNSNYINWASWEIVCQKGDEKVSFLKEMSHDCGLDGCAPGSGDAFHVFYKSESILKLKNIKGTFYDVSGLKEVQKIVKTWDKMILSKKVGESIKVTECAKLDNGKDLNFSSMCKADILSRPWTQRDTINKLVNN